MTVERGVWAAPESLDAAALTGFGRRVEELGYSTLWLGETFGRDPFAQCAHLGAHTAKLRLATGIANVFNRHPGVMKQGANSVAELTGGRFVLGLGVSSPQIVERGRGIPYDKPLTYVTDYLDRYDEALYLAVEPPEPVPVVLAALGPKMLELAAQRTAGAHPYNVTPEHTAAAREVLGQGPELIVEQKVMLTTDSELARETAASVLRFYVKAPGYVRNWLRLGFSEEEITGLAPRFVDAMVVWGEPEAIEQRLSEHADAGASQICIQVLHPRHGISAVHDEALVALAPS